MADKINFSCSMCGAKYYGTANMIGRDARCAKCKKVFIIEKQAVSDDTSIIELNIAGISETSAISNQAANAIIKASLVIVLWILSLITTYHITTYYCEGKLGESFIKSELSK